MVHALLQTHSILRPNGFLINVHDIPAPHVVAVHSPESVQKVGWLLDRDDLESERSSLNALAKVVGDGYFSLEDERNFGYNIYVDDLNELQEWLAEWWESAVLTERTIQKLGELIRDPGKSTRIVLNLQTRMTKLIRV